MIHNYSAILETIHDDPWEPDPAGPERPGRGAHYSIFNTLVWHDGFGRPISTPRNHTFALIWDEDRDSRVIRVIESLHHQGLLSSVLVIGERKGSLSVVVDEHFSDVAKFDADLVALAMGWTDPWAVRVTRWSGGDDELWIIQEPSAENWAYLQLLREEHPLGPSPQRAA